MGGEGAEDSGRRRGGVLGQWRVRTYTAASISHGAGLWVGGWVGGGRTMGEEGIAT